MGSAHFVLSTLIRQDVGTMFSSLFKGKSTNAKQLDENPPQCALCKFAKPITLTDEFLCQFSGVVKSQHNCKKYAYNLLLHEAKRKRQVDVDSFTPDDFSID
ncbi:MAG: hypothetical protein H7Y41_01640 [Hyphomonadaceae bacterium]|nr:hypothetical protein [Clostridia bacterium]